MVKQFGAPPTWTSEQAKDLEARWNAGDSAGMIGRDLGRTRNSVISKVHRMGLSGETRPVGRTASRRLPSYIPPRTSNLPPTPPRKSRPAAGNVVRGFNPTNHKVSAARAGLGPKSTDVGSGFHARTADEDAAGSAPKDFADLTARECRWPSGETAPYKFCADPICHDSPSLPPYCAKHYRMAGRGVPGRAR